MPYNFYHHFGNLWNAGCKTTNHGEKEKPSNSSEKIFGAIAEILGGRVLEIEGMKFYVKIGI